VYAFSVNRSVLLANIRGARLLRVFWRVLAPSAYFLYRKTLHCAGPAVRPAVTLYAIWFVLALSRMVSFLFTFSGEVFFCPFPYNRWRDGHNPMTAHTYVYFLLDAVAVKAYFYVRFLQHFLSGQILGTRRVPP
jgi:hypothetical protein